MVWGDADPMKRGPVVVSRAPDTVRRRNAVGAHGGYASPRVLRRMLMSSRRSYSVYYALAVAAKEIDTQHRPDFTDTEPAVDLGPFPAWGDEKKIVSMDPFGHLSPWLFRDVMESDNVDIRPTIAVTRAHMKLPELESSVKEGRLVPDGKICLNAGGELAVTKFAVEPASNTDFRICTIG